MKHTLGCGALIVGILVVTTALAGCQKKETPSVPENLKTAVEQLSGGSETPKPAAPVQKPAAQPRSPKAVTKKPEKASARATQPDTTGNAVRTAQRYAVRLTPAVSDNPDDFDLHPAGPEGADTGYFTLPDSHAFNGIRMGADFGVYGAASCTGTYTVTGLTGKVSGAETAVPGLCFWYGENAVFPLKISIDYDGNVKKNMKIMAVSGDGAVFESAVVSLGQAHGFQYARLWPEVPQDLSGTPVTGSDGNIIGVFLAARYAGNGAPASVVIPADAVVKTVNAIRARPAPPRAASRDTDRGWFGLKLEELTPDIREALGLSGTTSGLLVKQVSQNGPAARAGVLPGDILTVFNDVPLTGAVDQLAELSSRVTAGQTVGVSVLRQGSVVSLAITTQTKETP